MDKNVEKVVNHLFEAKNLIEKINLSELDVVRAGELLWFANQISAYINENYDFRVSSYFDVKPKIRVNICLNSSQLENSEVEEYDFYVYDSNGVEIESMWAPNQLAFQAIDRLEKLQSEYEITDVAWLDLKGNRMNPID